MEFKSLTNIETSFRQIRLFCAGIYMPVRPDNGLCRVELLQLRRITTAENIRLG